MLFDLLLAVLAINLRSWILQLGLANIVTFALSLLVPTFFNYRGGCCFLCILDVLAIFFGLVVI